MTVVDTDVLVIGSGVAGLTFALKLADEARVTLVTKKHRAESNTNYAQGGIAAVMDDEDSVELHVRDTLAAGAGLCHPEAVRELAAEGPERIRELIAWGVEFSRSGARLHLGMEGGHSRRRIVHSLDRTGRAIEHALLEAVAEHPRIHVLEDHLAVDLLIASADGEPSLCAGARVLDRISGEVVDYHARCTLLATGGIGRVYRHTTNPAIATGDGLAMAFRAGVELGNLEFVQFHPTALFPAEDRAVLISEAVRGEGAELLRIDGTPLMSGRKGGSLATRDVVARAIDLELKSSGSAHVLLDLAPIPPATIRSRFPNIAEECAVRGLDITRDSIPVVPAAHYVCGGVWTDREGRTSMTGLFAAGEVALTGVHGANRLASNSLLEAVVYSHRAAVAVARELRAGSRPIAEPDVPQTRVAGMGAGEETGAVGLEERLRTIMWDHAGIVRSNARLTEGWLLLRELEGELEARLEGAVVGAAMLELRNLVTAGRLILLCALNRKESRGLHFNIDHPEPDDERFLQDTLIRHAAAPEAAR